MKEEEEEKAKHFLRDVFEEEKQRIERDGSSHGSQSEGSDSSREVCMKAIEDMIRVEDRLKDGKREVPSSRREGK